MPPRKPDRSRTLSRPRWTRIAALLALVLTGAVASGVALSRDDERSRALDRVLDQMFLDRGVDRADLSARTVDAEPDGGPVAEVQVPLPEGETWARWNAGLTRAVEEAGGTVLDAVETGPDPERPDGLEIRLGRGHEVTHHVTVRREDAPFAPEKSGAPRVALVFDDLGYTTGGMARELLEIEGPLTFAVLPGLAHSEDFARLARERGHEVILHVPMEPLDPDRHDPGSFALDPGLPLDENRRRLRRQLGALSSYDGVSNHMGSRATAEPGLMDLVMEEVRGHDSSLFVLDSRTTPYSVVADRARRAGVRHAENNLFLDGSDEYGTIAGIQAARVASIARRRGQAIAIGHVRRDTVDAVRDAVDDWKREGIRLVPLSDLMHR